MFVIQNQNTRKKSFMFLTLFVCVIFCVQTVSAYVAYKLLSVPAIKQEQSNWCWAASTEMVANFFGANSTQTAIVTYVKGSASNVGGTVYDMQKGLSKYNVKSTPILTSVSYQTVINETTNGQPLIASIAWTSGGGHALVIRGYYQDTSVSKNDVYYVDPWDATYNIKDYNAFLSNSSWNWVNTVHAIYV